MPTLCDLPRAIGGGKRCERGERGLALWQNTPEANAHMRAQLLIEQEDVEWVAGATAVGHK